MRLLDRLRIVITDQRMSRGSGKVPAAIHVSSKALPEGPLARLTDGMWCGYAAGNPWVDVLDVGLAARPAAPRRLPPAGVRRKLFALMRHHCDDAEAGGLAVFAEMDAEQ